MSPVQYEDYLLFITALSKNYVTFRIVSAAV